MSMRNSTTAAERTSRARRGQRMRSTTAKGLVTDARFCYSLAQLLLGRMRSWKGRWRMIPGSRNLTYTTRCWNGGMGGGRNGPRCCKDPAQPRAPGWVWGIEMLALDQTATSHPQQCQILLQIMRYLNYCLKPLPQVGRRGIAPQKERIWMLQVEKNRGLRDRVERRVWQISSFRVKNGNSEITQPSFESSAGNCLTPGSWSFLML